METKKTRLIPFLFTPDTNFRFILLFTSVFGVSLFAYNLLYLQTHREIFDSTWERCSLNAQTAFPLGTGNSSNIEDITQQLESIENITEETIKHFEYLNECGEPVEQSETKWILEKLGLLFLVATLIYCLTPLWHIWRDKLRVFSYDDDPEIMDCLINLCHTIGLSKQPIFLIRALNLSTSGLVFGYLGKYYVVLNSGLLTLYYQDIKRFKAIILHELAHIVNKDIDKTYFSLSVSISFLLLTLIPLVIGNTVFLINNFKENIYFFFGQVISASIYIPSIYIILASILRSRELYADARTAMIDNQTIVLRNELITLLPIQSSIFKKLFDLHPNPIWRVKVLDEPSLLFQLTLLDVFLTGFISTFALTELTLFLDRMFSPSFEGFAILCAIFLFVPFVVSVIGIGIWQKIFVNQILKQKSHSFGRLGFVLGLGILTGDSLSFNSLSTLSLLDDIVYKVFLGGILLISLFLFFRWVALGASIWLETVTNLRDLRRIISFGLLVAGVIVSVWMSGFFLLWKSGYKITMAGISYINFLIQGNLVSYLEVVSFLLVIPTFLLTTTLVFPLLSKLRKPRISLQDIFIGDNQTAYLPGKIHLQQNLFPSLLAGLATAFGFIAILAIVRILLHFIVDESIRTTDQWIISFNIIVIGIAVFVQILLTTIVSAFVKQNGWAYGLFSAFIAGCLITLGAFILREISDCITIIRLGNPYSCSNFYEATFLSPIIIFGMLLSFIPAVISSWAGSFFRNLFSKPH